MELARRFEGVQVCQRRGGGGVERDLVRALFNEAGKLFQRAEILDDGEAERGIASIDGGRAEPVITEPATDCGEGFHARGGEA